jgi:hypothetical protein
MLGILSTSQTLVPQNGKFWKNPFSMDGCTPAPSASANIHIFLK